MRRRCRQGVEVAVRVEVDEMELGLRRERSRERAGDERALAADDAAGRARAHAREDAVGERTTRVASGGEEPIPRDEGDADALLAAQALRDRRSERRGGLRQTRQALLGDDAGLEQMDRSSGHLWAHGSPGAKHTGDL